VKTACRGLRPLTIPPGMGRKFFEPRAGEFANATALGRIYVSRSISSAKPNASMSETAVSHYLWRSPKKKPFASDAHVGGNDVSLRKPFIHPDFIDLGRGMTTRPSQ
jgi:hypothetical protein